MKQCRDKVAGEPVCSLMDFEGSQEKVNGLGESEETGVSDPAEDQRIQRRGHRASESRGYSYRSFKQYPIIGCCWSSEWVLQHEGESLGLRRN